MSVEKYTGKQVQIIYQDKKGEFTKRTISVRSVDNGKLKAFDMEKKAFRVFELDRILTIMPVGRSA